MATNIKAVKEFWKSFDLDAKRIALDKQGLDIADNRENSMKSRKKLAEATKSFRKTPDEVKLKGFGTLLKQYQEEVDQLTRRSRYAETSFLTIYQALSEAPNPLPAIEASSSSSDSSKDMTIKKLKAEIEEYESEFANLKNQDITIRELEVQLEELRSEMDKRVEDAIKEKEEEFNAKSRVQIDQATEQDEAMLGQLEELQNALLQAQQMYDQAQDQIFELRTSLEEKDDGPFDQSIDEDTSAENQALKQECEKLRDLLSKERLSRSKGIANNVERERMRALELEDELKRKQELIDQLNMEKAKYGSEWHDKQATWKQTIEELELKLNQSNDSIEQLKVECEARPTVDELMEVKSKLRLLQAFEFNSGVEPSDDVSNQIPMSDTERLLYARVRKLEATASTLRVQLENSRQEVEHAKTQQKVAEDQLTIKLELLEQLEKENIELERVAEKGQSRKDSIHTQDSAATHSTPQTSQLLRQVLDENAQTSTLPNDLESGNQDVASINQILHEQRDRFRKRVLDLETEKSSLTNANRKLNQSLSQLQTDNVKLYEKIRFLQSFNKSYKVSNRITEYHGLNQNQMLEMRSSEPDVEIKYKGLYDDHMNPFNDFTRRERNNRFKKLNQMEKLTYSATRFFMMNKYTRSFVFVYAIGLHLLVFFTMWFMTHTGYRKCQHFGHPPLGNIPDMLQNQNGM